MIPGIVSDTLKRYPLSYRGYILPQGESIWKPLHGLTSEEKSWEQRCAGSHTRGEQKRGGAVQHGENGQVTMYGAALAKVWDSPEPGITLCNSAAPSS